MVEKVVDANGASEIVTRAMQTVNVVSKKVSEKVGPIREQILDTAAQTIGRSTLIDGAMDLVDMWRALDILKKASTSNSNLSTLVLFPRFKK